MPFYMTIVLQTALTVLQVLSMSSILPASVHVGVATAISAIQGVLAAVAHNYNPNGTPVDPSLK